MMNRIKELRKQKDLSLKQLSKSLKEKGLSLSADSISKYERGARNPKIENWVKLAKFFNVSIAYLKGEDLRMVSSDRVVVNEKQKNCPYCHEPFLDLSGKTGSEVDDDESAYCGTDDYGNLEYGASFDSGCVNKAEYVKIKYCPMCGRDLRRD